MNDSQKVGFRGEQLAARYMVEQGYEIICSNYATKAGELDIVALKKKLLCFTEVKTRSPGQMLPPGEAVDFYKQERIKAAAAAFAKAVDMTQLEQRFDVCEVILKNLREADITYQENAF